MRFKTNSAVLSIKRKNKESKKDCSDYLIFEIFLRKIKVCIKFTLKGFSSLRLLFLRRKKVNFEKFQKGLLINYTVQRTGVLLISSYLLTWQKDFCSNFLLVRLLPWYFVNLLICLGLFSDVYPKALFYCFLFGSTTLTFVYFSLELIWY